MDSDEEEESKELSSYFYLGKGNNNKLIKDALMSRGYSMLDYGMKFSQNYRVRWV